jgi:hypothetical protein
MRKASLAGLSSMILSQLCFAQQQPDIVRAGDAFRSYIKHVRSEIVRLRTEDGAIVEGPRVLFQEINYSQDALTREIVSYKRGSIAGRRVEPAITYTTITYSR